MTGIDLLAALLQSGATLAEQRQHFPLLQQQKHPLLPMVIEAQTPNCMGLLCQQQLQVAPGIEQPSAAALQSTAHAVVCWACCCLSTALGCWLHVQML